MPVCTNCRSDVDEDASVCPNCGAVFEDSIDQQAGEYSTPSTDLATNYIFIAAISIVFLLLNLWNTATARGAASLSVSFSTQPLFYTVLLAGIGLWTTTVIGLKRRTTQSVQAASYALNTITLISLVGFVTYMSRFAMPGVGYARLGLPLLDPLSNFVITILGSERIRLPPFAYDALLLVGTALLVGMTIYLHRKKPTLSS
jgi:hypothetical protein